MAYLVTTEAEIEQKSGANVSAAYDTTAMENAEKRGLALLNCLTRYNWADNLPTNADVKAMLSNFISSFVAIEAINYDMSGFTSRSEAESMITVLRDGMMRDAAIIRDEKQQTFIKENAA